MRFVVFSVLACSLLADSSRAAAQTPGRPAGADRVPVTTRLAEETGRSHPRPGPHARWQTPTERYVGTADRRLPAPGHWMLVARAGDNWGCFRFRLPAA